MEAAVAAGGAGVLLSILNVVTAVSSAPSVVEGFCMDSTGVVPADPSDTSASTVAASPAIVLRICAPTPAKVGIKMEDGKGPKK